MSEIDGESDALWKKSGGISQDAKDNILSAMLEELSQ
jgi:hypothetical protein